MFSLGNSKLNVFFEQVCGYKKQWPEECFATGKNSIRLKNLNVLMFFGYYSKNQVSAVKS